MVKINWSVYILVGVIILFASYKIDVKKFTIFIWLGYLFLVIGIAKLGIGFVTRKKETRIERNQIIKEIYRSITPKKRIVFCPRCRLNLHGYENFCPRCGLRIR